MFSIEGHEKHTNYWDVTYSYKGMTYHSHSSLLRAYGRKEYANAVWHGVGMIFPEKELSDFVNVLWDYFIDLGCDMEKR